MPSYAGSVLARQALREVGVLDPVQAGHAEQIADAIIVGTDLLDSWRTKRLTISGVTRTVYSLTSGTQAYTIGSGGAFDQEWPESIPHWSVIPDDDATDVDEYPMGRPYTDDEWRVIRVKSDTAAYPTVLYFDRRFVAGLGTCLFWPVPDNGDVDVVLYNRVPAIVSLVAATTYNLRPGMARALKLNWAIELADRYGKPVSASLERRAREALRSLEKSNIIPRESSMRAEFAIGATGSGFDIRRGS